MANLGKTLYVQVEVYIYDSNRTLKSSEGEYSIILPYADPNVTYPTGDLVYAGVTQDLLVTLGNYIQDFQTVGSVHGFYTSSDYDHSVFDQIFPNEKLIKKTSTNDFLVLVNKKSGKVYAFYTSSTGSCYNSISDFISNNPNSTAPYTRLFTASMASGSGAIRGDVYLTFYSGYDEITGRITALKDLWVDGVTSTTQRLRAYGWYNGSGLDAVLDFLGVPDVSPVTFPDPFDGAGDSEPGTDYAGTFDYTGNPPGGFADFEFPSISAVDTGFVTLFNPTALELKQLSAYLWSNNFDLNTFKKLFNDPMELFLGLSIVPVDVPDGGQKEVGIGLINTGIYMTVAASQWVSVSCGSVDVPLFSDSYLDFDPYTSVEIYLPYIGSRTLKADEVMGRTLEINYTVDILSGACVAWLDIDGHVTYCFMGQCATSIPMVSGDWTNLINGILSIVGGAVGGAVKGGVGGAIAGGVAAASSVAVSDGKISVERSGSISSAGGLLAPQKPILIISSPRICKPAEQYAFEGYPAYITYDLRDLSGFTIIENIHLQGIQATDAELAEIESLLKSGVIF